MPSLEKSEARGGDEEEEVWEAPDGEALMVLIRTP